MVFFILLMVGAGLVFVTLKTLSTLVKSLAQLRLLSETRNELLQLAAEKASNHQLNSLKQVLNVSTQAVEVSTQVVDVGAGSVEKVHKVIADASFNVLGSVAPVNAEKNPLKKAHDKTAKEVYGSIRKVNSIIGGISKTIRTTTTDTAKSELKDIETKRQD